MYERGKPPTKKQFNDLFKKREKYMCDEIGEVLDDLENSENFFKIDSNI